jgi:hypothetical protein
MLNNMRSFIFTAAAGLMLLAATPAKAGVRFPNYPTGSTSLSADEIALMAQIKGMAGVAWHDEPSEEARRECLTVVALYPKLRGEWAMEGWKMYEQLTNCLLHEDYDIRKYDAPVTPIKVHSTSIHVESAKQMDSEVATDDPLMPPPSPSSHTIPTAAIPPAVPAKAAQTGIEFPEYPIEPGCRKPNMWVPACVKTGSDAKASAHWLWSEVSEQARFECVTHVWKSEPAYIQYQKLEGCLEAQFERQQVGVPPYIFKKG